MNCLKSSLAVNSVLPDCPPPGPTAISLRVIVLLYSSSNQGPVMFVTLHWSRVSSDQHAVGSAPGFSPCSSSVPALAPLDTTRIFGGMSYLYCDESCASKLLESTRWNAVLVRYFFMHIPTESSPTAGVGLYGHGFEAWPRM